MPFQPFVPDEPQAKHVVQYSPPVTAPIAATPRAATARIACISCNRPVWRSGQLCPTCYYIEAVNGRGKQHHGFFRRPGMWVPPLLVVLTEVVGYLCLGPMILFLGGILPVIMFVYIFGAKPNPRSQEKWNDRMDRINADGAAMQAQVQDSMQAFNDRLGY